jgi:DNA-binding response OmpR family regulator
MSRAISPETRINLERTSALLINDNPQGLDILSSIVQGFGLKEQIRCAAPEDARAVVKRRSVDMVLVECASATESCDFVRWMRREGPKTSAYTPVIILTGHASEGFVAKSRDCGASFIVTKPLTPMILLQRILWLTRDQREWVECDTYVGPDRRVRNYGPPMGMAGRRAGDLSAHVGVALEPNMDQSDIDMLLKPQRVAL